MNKIEIIYLKCEFCSHVYKGYTIGNDKHIFNFDTNEFMFYPICHEFKGLIILKKEFDEC